MATLLAALCATSLAPRLGAQVVASVSTRDSQPSPLELRSSGWAANELDLALTVSQPGQAFLQLTGIAKAGKHQDDPYHRNSFWVSLVMRNDTGKSLRGIELELQPLTGPNTPLDGVSFGALSLNKAQEVLARRQLGTRTTLEALSDPPAFPNNFWGFTGAVLDGDSEESLAIGFPIRKLADDPLRFHYFEAAGAKIDPGEDIQLRFLVTQNGPANGAYLAFTLTAVVPEPGQIGLVCAGLLGAVALGRIWQRRKPKATAT
jgi:hypothetical protein